MKNIILALPNIFDQFITGMQATAALEYVAVFSGILSVWYSRKENILVYPIGLINTVIYIYISLKGGLLGEASVNLYYTVMSIWGWILWSRKSADNQSELRITRSTMPELFRQCMLFIIFYLALYAAIVFMSSKGFITGAIPWADAFASAAAYTGMWLMNKKKVASWYWWILTNVASIPLYFVKGYVFTSVYYLVLLAMAFSGLVAWRRKAGMPAVVI